MKRTITNEEFEEAYRNSNNRNLLHWATRKYGKGLHKEDRDDCGRLALWRALRSHDPCHSSGQKFTSSLVRFVKWECLNRLRDTEYRHLGLDAAENIPAVDGPSVALRDSMVLLPEDERKTLIQYYFEKQTLEEVGAASGAAPETVRRKLQRAISRLRLILDSV